LNGFGYLGVVKLYVYSPLTGLDNVDGTVWITASNVEVSLPTGLPIVTSGPAQAGSLPTPKTQKDKNLKANPPKQRGPISTVAEGVGQVASVLKDVPVIGGIASAVEWGSSVVSSVASFFGFSKPIDHRLPSKDVLVVGNNLANYDGDSKAKSLAFCSCNETEIPVNVFGTEQDEMSFSHILAQPVYLNRFKMQKVDKQSSIIWKWPVDPMSCQKIIPNDSTKAPYIPDSYICQNTFLSYLSNFFKFYRGTIHYHLRIIKTAFHSGRIRVFVVPGAIPSTDVTSIDFNKVHSVVYDLRDTTKFDIVVPYKWNTPWKALDTRFTQDAGILTPNRPTAMIYIQVVNALRNPSTAADHIEFIVETSAGEDFQFALPMTNSGTRLIPSEEALKTDYPAQPTFSTRGPAQSGINDSVETLPENAGGEQIVANKIAIGEIITGWRTLLKRYHRWLRSTETPVGWILQPYATTAQENSVKDDFDLFSACELLYRYRAGSLRVASETVEGSKDNIMVKHELAPHNSQYVQKDTTAAIIQSEVLEPLMEISIPFYQETPALPTSLGVPKEAHTEDLKTGYTAMPYNEGTMMRSNKRMNFWRATGEDFAFGHLVGPPKTIIQYTGTRCADDWKGILAPINTRDFYAEVAPSEDVWTMTRVNIKKLISDAAKLRPTTEMLAVVDQIFDNDHFQKYMASPSPTEAQDALFAFGSAVYSPLLDIFNSVCIV